MIEILLNELYLFIWLIIFYATVYVFHRFVPRGIFIAQILFILVYAALPYYNINYIGYLEYDTIPILWIVASLLLLFSLHKKR